MIWGEQNRAHIADTNRQHFSVFREKQIWNGGNITKLQCFLQRVISSIHVRFLWLKSKCCQDTIISNAYASFFGTCIIFPGVIKENVIPENCS